MSKRPRRLRQICSQMSLLPAIAVMLAAWGAGAQNSEIYRNDDYRYTVNIPKGLHAEGSAAPNPNHGLKIRLSNYATLWVLAYYTDARNLREAVDIKIKSPKCILIRQHPSSLSGKSARALSLRCVKTGRITTQEVTIGVSKQPGRGLVEYEVGIECQPGGCDEFGNIYRQLLDGVRIEDKY